MISTVQSAQYIKDCRVIRKYGIENNMKIFVNKYTDMEEKQ